MEDDVKEQYYTALYALATHLRDPLIFTYWLYDSVERPRITVSVHARYDAQFNLIKAGRGIAICSIEDIRAQSFTKKQGQWWSRERAKSAYIAQESRLPITSLRVLKTIGNVMTTTIRGQSFKLRELPFTHKLQAGPRFSLTQFEADALHTLFTKRQEWYAREAQHQLELAIERVAIPV